MGHYNCNFREEGANCFDVHEVNLYYSYFYFKPDKIENFSSYSQKNTFQSLNITLSVVAEGFVGNTLLTSSPKLNTRSILYQLVISTVLKLVFQIFSTFLVLFSMLKSTLIAIRGYKGRVINKEVSLDELNFNTIPTPGSMVI